MSQITLPSGAQAVINMADFEDAMGLSSALLSEISASGVQLPGLSGFAKLSQLDMSADVDLSGLMQAALRVIGSKSIRAALWPCLSRCLYRGQKIVPATFEDAAAREDYFPLAVAVVKENLRPFFSGLSSAFSGALAGLQKSEAPASK